MEQYQTIEQIILQCMDDIREDVESLKGILGIDFLDIFPKSVEHKELLDKEALKISKMIDETSRGNFYVLNKPIKTIFGLLKIIKIRVYDESRLNWVAAPDFAIVSYSEFEKHYKNDDRFTYIEKPVYKGLEFKTDKSLIYFLDELTTDYYKVK